MSDPYRVNRDFDKATELPWVVRNPPEEFLASYEAGESLEVTIGTTGARFPEREAFQTGFMLYMSADKTVSRLTAATRKGYCGLLWHPAPIGNFAQVFKRGGAVLLPVGSVGVVRGRAVMADPAPIYGGVGEGTDIVRQWTRKVVRIVQPKTCAGAVDQAGTAPAAGDTTIEFDGLNSNYGWQPGDTIHNTTLTPDEDMQIVSITYTSATEGTITVETGIVSALWADDDVLTNEHIQDAPIFVDCNDDFLWDNIKALNAARLTDVSVYDVDNLVVGTGATPGTGEIVLSGNSVLVDTVVQEGDILELDLDIWDDTVYIWTVGIAKKTQATIRTATAVQYVEVEI